MTSQGQILIIIFCLLVLIFVINALRQRKIDEANVLWWTIILTLVIILTANKRLLMKITRLMGAFIPVSILTLLGLAFILMMLVFFSMRISTLSSQVKRLTQHLALMENKFTEIKRNEKIENL